MCNTSVNNHARQIKAASAKGGFTLVELMITTAVVIVVMGALMSLSIALNRTTQVQSAKLGSMQQARKALDMIGPELRQASGGSINVSDLPGRTITYRIPVDIDGNGFAIDQNNEIELSAIRTITYDTDDLNNDGLTNQIVLDDGTNVSVLATNVNPGVEIDSAGDGFDSSDDTNENGRQDLGFYIDIIGGGTSYEITVQTVDKTPRGLELNTVLTERISPRNH